MGSNFLKMINGPDDLKHLTKEQINQLADEIRKEIIYTVAKNGGHLAPNLGTVELTIALHYVFNSPKDKIIWDVGHQAYPHKLLTGRYKDFSTIRTHKGISGYLKIKESEHDIFGAGHASTSISAALGVAKARDLKGEDFSVIAVIGDGSMTGGMAFEALNNAGHLKSNMMVILNDNGMSISKNVGAWHNYLTDLVANPKYHKARKKLEKALSVVSKTTAKRAMRFAELARTAMTPGLLFKELGFHYYGPIDGHDIGKLITALKYIKKMDGPILLHIKSSKGHGWSIAEQDSIKWHGVGKFDPESGESLPSKGHITYTKAFSNMIIRLAKKDSRIVAITAAMSTGTGLDKFQNEFPDRFFDVGIAEQHAVTFAGGLAREGLKPIVAIYSTFLQRAYDQVIHDICLQNLNVIFAMDRAGLVGEDGPTHHGSFDISYMRTIPNLVIMVPKDENELGRMLKSAVDFDGPIAIRYPRGEGEGRQIYEDPLPVKIGKAKVLKKGKDICIIAVGPCVREALEAVDEIKQSCTVINARFVKPLDEKRILNEIKKCKKILTIEENALNGGFGSSIMELMQNNNIHKKVERLGIPDEFIDHGSLKILRNEIGIDKEGIIKKINEMSK